ncbi:hypothetical protein [Thiolapillus sp.]|uniref:hypothetical protein n=2 Tax=Thiolapillus sp. TaxID=2017437 RepID=UPI003AF8C75B
MVAYSTSHLNLWIQGTVRRTGMAEHPDKVESPSTKADAGWGKKLFIGTLIALLGFFYWLLIYSGGVTVHHG